MRRAAFTLVAAYWLLPFTATAQEEVVKSALGAAPARHCTVSH